MSIIAAGLLFTCTPVAVWDGDGPIWCAEGPKIRVAGVAAREMDGTCSKGHPCPDASAERARDYLASLLGKVTGVRSTGHLLVEGPAISCRSTGNAVGSRTGAWCTLPDGRDLSCELVKAGVAVRWERYWDGWGCAPKQ